MAAKKTVVYECEVCGTEVTVNSEGLSSLSPIYCCGISLRPTEKKSSRKPAARVGSEKKTVAKTAAKSSVRRSRKSVQ